GAGRGAARVGRRRAPLPRPLVRPGPGARPPPPPPRGGQRRMLGLASLETWGWGAPGTLVGELTASGTQPEG
ncbi:hypothetical protein, partial [Nocardia abscessus]|uniref:hypothetical protein n=1 Tax=Nocardia abscessus TaxID=120957 RepID=UPI002456162D